jgi:hypothetical protein
MGGAGSAERSARTPSGAAGFLSVAGKVKQNGVFVSSQYSNRQKDLNERQCYVITYGNQESSGGKVQLRGVLG